MAESLRKSDSFRIAARLSCSILFAMSALAAADLEMQLEAAIHREIVLGDLKGAIEGYKSILSEAQKSGPVAARALFQEGQCLDKLGRRTEAHDTYARVVKQYPDQPEIAAQARSRMAALENSVPGPLNLKFEAGAPGRLPAAWFASALPPDADRMAQLRRSGCMNAGSCAVVQVPENAPSPWGNLMQSFIATAYRGKTVRLTAWLKVESNGPDDRGQMWMGVDRANDRRGFYDNMNDRPVRSPDWTKCEIRARIDEDATFIKFGVMVLGRGRVWVDGVSFDVISR